MHKSAMNAVSSTSRTHVHKPNPTTNGPKEPTASTTVIAGMKTMTFYSRTRGDRSGSAILDMLMAHAFSFYLNKTMDNFLIRYGGACGKTPFATLPNQQKLILTLGLEAELPFNCPKNFTCDIRDPCKILEFHDYSSEVSKTFSSEWLRYIRSKTRRLEEARHGSDHFQISVHVRRGDITLCRTENPMRYSPNHYYIHLIDEYKPKDGRPCNISIFSNAEDPSAHNAQEPREPWQDFTSLGYNVFLGSDLGVTWETMMTGDILIMSKSSFSHVPAMLKSKGKVIYTPYWTEPMPGWVVVSDASRALSRKLMKQARKKYCSNFTKIVAKGQSRVGV
ncbi:hypothetical protein ACA910_022276 [Epithemia clementina (nom. ined.)]